MHSKAEGSGTQRALRSVIILASFSVVMSFLALLGWLAGRWEWMSLGTQAVPIAPATALLLFFLNGAFLLELLYPGNVIQNRFMPVVSWLATVTGLFALLRPFWGWSSPAEEWLAGTTAVLGGAPVGQMSPLTGFVFFLFGCSFLIRRLPWRGAHSVVSGTVALIAWISVAVIFSYLLEKPIFPRHLIIPMALWTGILFFLMSLAVLLQEHLGKDADSSDAAAGKQARLQRRWWLLAFCAVTAVIILFGFMYYRTEALRIEKETSDELAAIGKLKVEHILRWRKERVGDAERFTRSPLVRNLLERWLRDPGDREARYSLQERLALETDIGFYFQAFLVGPGDRVLLSSPEGIEVAPQCRAVEETAWKSAGPVLGELNQTPGGQIHLDVAGPILDVNGSALAVAIFSTSGEEFLFPMIEEWPVLSHTAETLLVRRERDEVLFLNELRHHKKTALFLRFPLTQTTLPAAQAVLGRTGFFFGKDYRGVEVLSDLRPVPGTAWHLVTKIDAGEVLDEVRSRALVIFTVAFVLVMAVAGLLSFLYQSQRVKERERTAEILRKMNQELEERVRQRTAELSAAVKELDAFSYSVSHDLKAPLRAMTGFANILMEDYGPKLDENGKRVIGVIHENTAKMGQLIEDLLKLCHLGRKEMEVVEIDTGALVQSLSRELKEGSFRERAMEVSVKPLLPVRADPTLVRQIFTNLIVNAMKFTASREKALIEIGGYQEGRERVYYVKDNGAGFDMQYANKLFGIFQRLHPQNEFAGTGIGLAIVRSAVERHGGRVWAEGKINEGASFYVAFPQGE